MKRKAVHRVIVGILLLVLAGALSACDTGGANGGEPVKIGVQGPMTGQWALEGEGFRNAVTLIAAQVNADGGVLEGRKLEIIEGDDRGDPDEARRVAERMVDAGVIAVIGSYNSDATKGAAEVYDEAGILHITPSSTATELTEQGYKLFMRVCFLDNRQGAVVARLITKDLGKEKVAIIHDDSLYAKGLADWAQRYLEDEGAEVTYFDAITPGQRDFAETVETLEDLGTEALYFTGYWRDAGMLVKNLHELGADIQFIAGDAVNNPEFVEIAGAEAATGTLITTSPLPQDIDTPEAKAFIADYVEEYGEAPSSIYTLMAADALRLIVHSIEKTLTTEPAKLSAYLHNLKDYPGVTGLIEGYNVQGDRLGTGHVIYRVNAAGAFELYTP